MDQFKVFRAIGLSFKAWFANFIPITLLAGILFAPSIYFFVSIPNVESTGDVVGWVSSFEKSTWMLLGAATLLAPMLTYRVIQYMNGSKSSFIDSIKHGFRGIIPAVVLAGIDVVLTKVPFGGLIAVVLTCYWFVAAPVAVVERTNPIAAFGRSNQLTAGRRGGIFGLLIMLAVVQIVIYIKYLGPILAGTAHGMEDIHQAIFGLKLLIIISYPYQLFLGIVQAVSYSLLRSDKDGVSNEELAKVFE